MHAARFTPAAREVPASGRVLTATDLALCLLPIGLFLSIVSLV